MSHDAHAAAPLAGAPHGPTEFPPVPAVRSISPAPEEYVVAAVGSGLLWPLVWLALTVVFVGLYNEDWKRGPVVETEHAAH